MTRFLPLLLLAFSLPLAVGAAPPLPQAVVTVRLAADGIDADVQLDRAVSRFDFADRSVVREGDFELRTSGLTLKGDSVTAAAPFRAFQVHIRPAPQERDAHYPAHFRIGAGGILYAPALAADPAAWRTRLVVRTGPGEVRAPQTGGEQGFIFVGPAALLRTYKGIAVVADPATPLWLVEQAETDLAAAVDAYGRALHARLPERPLLIVRHRGGDRNFNVGDVTPGAITSLRFYGDAWKQPDPKAAQAIRSFVLHEAFHFWNGGIVHHAEGTPTWLHEGGAEYASLLGGRESGILSDADVRARLSQALERCRSGLGNQGDKALSQIPFLSDQLRYPCGMVLQWAIDLRMRQASDGRRTVLDAWAATVRTGAARKSHAYTLADFYAAAGISDPRAFAPIRLLVDESGPARWDALPAAFSALGAEVGQAPSADARRVTLFFHLLRQNCDLKAKDMHFGFYADGGRIKLDSPAQCGVLAGDPVLKTVEGGDPFAPSAATFEAVQRKCAAKANVEVVTADGRTLAAACNAPLPPAPLAYSVTRWRPAEAGASSASAR